MKIRTGLAAFVLLCAVAGNAQTQEKSSTLNNSANRAASEGESETQRFEQVPGGRATPKKEWKKGDRRGKPQKPRVSRRQVKKNLQEQRGEGR